MNNKRLFAKNSVAGIVQKIIVALITIITIPVFINILGKEVYGIFATLTILGSLDRLTNFGLNLSIIKFLSIQGKSKESNYDIITALIILSIVLIPVSAILIVFRESIIINIFNIPKLYYNDIKYLYVHLVISNFILFIGGPINAILVSQKKIYLSSLYQVINSVLYWGLMLIAISFGYTIKHLGIGILIASSTWFIITTISAFRVWGKLSLGGYRKNFRKNFKKQFSYSIKVYASGLIGLMGGPFVKILISQFIGVNEVGFYDIALRIQGQLQGFLNAALWPLFQFFSEEKDRFKVKRVIKNVQSMLFILAVPASIFFIFTTYPIVTVWIGGADIKIIAASIIVLCVSDLIFFFSVLPTYYYLNSFRPMKIFIIECVYVFVPIIILLSTIRHFGYYSVLLGYSLGGVSSFILNQKFFHNIFHEFHFSLFSNVLKLLSFFGIQFILLFFINNFIHMEVIKIITYIFVIAIGSLLMARLMKLITKDNIEYFFGTNKKISITLLKLFV